MTASPGEAAVVFIIYLAIIGPSMFVWYMLYLMNKVRKERNAHDLSESRLSGQEPPEVRWDSLE